MKPRGVALVTALLVVALATLAATALMSTASLAIHRTASLRDSEAAWWVARGVEAWITGLLKQDPQKYDGKDEAWAQPVEALPIDQGFLRGKLVDEMGRFNLNNLLVPQTDPNYAKYAAHFNNLLGQLPTTLQIPPGLIGAIRDWGDPDQNVSLPDGAEDGIYQSLEPGYRTADRPFTVVSELRAVHGMTPELYAALSPLLAALPESGTAINVNTAEEEVLYAIPGADHGEVENFIKVREQKPAEDKAGIPPTMQGAIAPPVGWQTHWFQIQGEVFVGSSRVALYSLIKRSAAGTSTVLAHSADAE